MEQKVIDPVVLKALGQFKALDEKITHFSSIIGLADWDQKVMAPKKGEVRLPRQRVPYGRKFLSFLFLRKWVNC